MSVARLNIEGMFYDGMFVSDFVRVGVTGCTFTVPLALETVAAGWPSAAQDYYSDDIDLNTHLISNRSATFIVRVSGDSMLGAGISDGDELIVDRSLTPRNGQVVIAVLNGELTVKRLEISSSGVFLKADNPKYADIRVSEMSELRIWGVVTRCLHYVK